jgi:AcrR family transcriptional regulator
MSPRERARRGEGEKLRHEIIEAGKQLLFDAGDEGAVTIRAVANAVGVSPPSIYLHFADKDTLLVAVCEETFTALDEAIEQAAAGIADPVEALHVRGRAYVEFGLENPEQYRILFMTRTAVMEKEIPAPDAFNHHLEAVQRAHDAGALRDGLDPVQAAMSLWAGAHGITSLLIAKPNFDWPARDGLIDGVLAAVVRGVSR